jgi:cbb3-type cytochrome oxidase subunit 1
VRDEPVLKFMVVAITAYGMSTLEGPLLSTKFLNSISERRQTVAEPASAAAAARVTEKILGAARA